PQQGDCPGGPPGNPRNRQERRAMSPERSPSTMQPPAIPQNGTAHIPASVPIGPEKQQPFLSSLPTPQPRNPCPKPRESSPALRTLQPGSSARTTRSADPISSAK